VVLWVVSIQVVVVEVVLVVWELKVPVVLEDPEL
jgi:hypothetical protein